MYVHALTHVQGSIVYHYIMKLLNINVYIKTKVLFKFCILEIMCMEMRSKKQLKKIANKPMHVKFRCTCMYMYENEIEADTLRMKNISFVSY